MRNDGEMAAAYGETVAKRVEHEFILVCFTVCKLQTAPNAVSLKALYTVLDVLCVWNFSQDDQAHAHTDTHHVAMFIIGGGSVDLLPAPIKFLDYYH